MWSFTHLVKDLAKSAFAHRVCSKENADPPLEKHCPTNNQVVNHLPPIHAADDVIAAAKAEITNFKQP